tara:strand:- start:583 stop:984 length:402 start_codon:yes stop_codon:yes gene_type:complete
MRKYIFLIILILSSVKAQDGRPFEINLTPRYVEELKVVVNVQLTNLTNKPLDYLEGFLIERTSSRKLVSEKRVILTAGYEPSLQKGYSSTRSISYGVEKGKPNTYEFVISKLKFNGESKIFTWHPKAGYIRID